MNSPQPGSRMKRAGSVRRVTGVSHPTAEGAEKTRTSTTLTVIVPCYNEQYLVATNLARLTILGKSALLNSVKVIVVDDGSRDGTDKVIAQF